MKIISIVFLFIISSVSIGDSSWSVAFETEADCFYGLRDCAVLSNGNAVVSLTGPFEDPYLICFDPDGEILWSRHILESESSRAFESNGELLTLENGFAACYHSEPRATGMDTDVAVVRIDSSGSILWTYILGENDEEIWMSTDMISCTDGGLLVTGCPGTMLPGGFLFKLSPDGRLEWMTQPEEIVGYATSIMQTVDGGYSVLVIDEYSGSTVVQRIDSDGVVSAPITVSDTTIPFGDRIFCINDSFWVSTVSESDSMRINQLYPDNGTQNEIIMQLPTDSQVQLVDILEGGLLVSGSTDDFNDALLLLYNLNGDLLWQRCYDTGAEDNLEKAVLSDFGILAMGNIDSISGEIRSFWILMTDGSGIVEGAGITENGTQVIEPEILHIELFVR